MVTIEQLNPVDVGVWGAASAVTYAGRRVPSRPIFFRSEW